MNAENELLLFDATHVICRHMKNIKNFESPNITNNTMYAMEIR